MKRATYKRLVKYAMFLLPALTALLAYTSFYDRLYKDADCIINCDDYDFNASRELQLNFQKMLALLNDKLPTQSQTKANRVPQSTSLDLAFLHEKMASLDSTSLQKNTAAWVASNADMVIASDLNNTDLDTIGLMQTASSGQEKQAITQPDSLAASINGMNPPIIIPSKPENGATSTSPNIPSDAGITPPNNTDPNAIKPVVASPVVMSNGSPISTVPLPSSLYLMLAGLAVLFMYNHSARIHKNHF